jgi:hypothetical protein
MNWGDVGIDEEGVGLRVNNRFPDSVVTNGVTGQILSASILWT